MAEEAPRPRRRVAEAVEKGVEGVYDFLFRLFNTLWLVSTTSRGARPLIEDRHSERARYVLPFTYAAVGIFLVSLVAGVAGYKILDWIWFDQEIPETIVANLREGVSLFAIAAGSIPAFLFMLALAAMLAVTIDRRRGRSGRALFVTCYAIGTQSMFLFVLALAVSSAQIFADSPTAPRPLSGDFATGVQLALALVAIVSVAGALIVPVRFFLKSFGPRQSRWRRLLMPAAYALISVISVWALPFMAALPGLLAAALKPSDAPTLSIEGDPLLYLDRGHPSVAVDVIIQNEESKVVGSVSTDAHATIRYGKEPLEGVHAGTLSLEPVRLENEAGQAVQYTSAAEGKLIWRRLIFRASADDVMRLVALADSSPASCVEVRLGSGDQELKSVCVRGTIRDERFPAPGGEARTAP